MNNLVVIVKNGVVQSSNFNIAFPNKVYTIMLSDFARDNDEDNGISCFSVRYPTVTKSSFTVKRTNFKYPTSANSNFEDSVFLVAIGL